MKRRALIPWSSGKESAWMLHVLRQTGEYEIAGLLTTVNAGPMFQSEILLQRGETVLRDGFACCDFSGAEAVAA